jgi:hypothetical protein
MTYREWMNTTGARFNMTEADAELILVNQSGIIPDPDETVDVVKAKTALCKEFAMVLPMANISEGGYSITWNIEAVKLWYRHTASELGLEDITTPKIRNRSNVW